MKVFVRTALVAVLVAFNIYSLPGFAADTLSTTNLILNVDGNISESYSGSGSTWTDRSTAGNNLTAGGGSCSSTLPAWSASEGGGSFQFSADKSCFKKDTLSAAPTNFSLFFWIKPTALPASGTYSYLAQINRNESLSDREYLLGFNSSGQLYFWDYDSGYGFSQVTSSASLTKVTVGEWQYVGFVKSGTTGNFYIGKAGTLNNVGTVTAAKNANYGTTSFVIGYDYRDNNNFYKGYMGAIHYYSAALTSSTISTNYSATLRAAQQSISISSLGTTSKSYPYSQALAITTSGSSGSGAKSYAVSDGTATGCALSDTSAANTTISATTSGTCLVTATIAASNGYFAATSAAQTFTFSKASQTITFSSLGTSSKIYPYTQALSMSTSGTSGSGGITYAIAAGGSATGCALSNSSASATISASTSGTCLVAATIAADANYNSATSSNLTFTFSKATPTFSSWSNVTKGFGDANYTVAAPTVTGSIAGTFSYSSSNTDVISISGTTFTVEGVGSATITATFTPTNATNYNSASTTNTVTVGRTSVSASLTLAPGNLVFRQAKNITAVATVAGKVTFRVAGKILPGCKNRSVNAGNSFTAICSYRPSNHSYVTITATLNPTDPYYVGTVTNSAQYLVTRRVGRR